MPKSIKEQFADIQKMRERFMDDAWDLLGEWLDEFDKYTDGKETPDDPIMREYARIFHAQELIGTEDEETDFEKEKTHETK